MDALIINPTIHTPSIILDKEAGIFEIAQRSLPENAIEFYEPVLYWINSYIKDPNEKTFFSFNLEYYNTSSSKQIAKILLMLEKMHLQNITKVKILWHYDAEDIVMLNSGKRYEKLLHIPFEFIVK